MDHRQNGPSMSHISIQMNIRQSIPERHVMAIIMYIERGATLAKPCSLDTPAMTKLRQAIQTIPH